MKTRTDCGGSDGIGQAAGRGGLYRWRLDGVLASSAPKKGKGFTMCFCSEIYDGRKLYSKKKEEMLLEWEKVRKREDDNFIYEIDGKYTIVAETGDSFLSGAVENIKYCPYCGRELCQV